MPDAASALCVSMVILRVHDLARAERFYTQALGLEATRRFGGFVFLDVGGVTLILNQPERAVPSVTSGLTEVVFSVADIQKSHRELVARGVVFLAPPQVVGHSEGYDRWVAPFRDPDGHLLSITSTTLKG